MNVKRKPGNVKRYIEDIFLLWPPSPSSLNASTVTSPSNSLGNLLPPDHITGHRCAFRSCSTPPLIPPFLMLPPFIHQLFYPLLFGHPGVANLQSP